VWVIFMDLVSDFQNKAPTRDTDWPFSGTNISVSTICLRLSTLSRAGCLDHLKDFASCISAAQILLNTT
jgi:hypothetical protein